MKTCDRCGKELTERDRTTICLECEVALADEVIRNLKSDNASLKAERDAAAADLKRIGECALCRKNGEQPACEDREGHERCFEWRGGE